MIFKVPNLVIADNFKKLHTALDRQQSNTDRVGLNENGQCVFGTAASWFARVRYILATKKLAKKINIAQE